MKRNQVELCKALYNVSISNYTKENGDNKFPMSPEHFCDEILCRNTNLLEDLTVSEDEYVEISKFYIDKYMENYDSYISKAHEGDIYRDPWCANPLYCLYDSNLLFLIDTKFGPDPYIDITKRILLYCINEYNLDIEKTDEITSNNKTNVSYFLAESLYCCVGGGEEEKYIFSLFKSLIKTSKGNVNLTVTRIGNRVLGREVIKKMVDILLELGEDKRSFLLPLLRYGGPECIGLLPYDVIIDNYKEVFKQEVESNSRNRYNKDIEVISYLLEVYRDPHTNRLPKEIETKLFSVSRLNDLYISYLQNK